MVSTGSAPARGPARRAAIYLLCSAGLILVYALTAPLLWINRDFAAEGPLGLHAPRATAALDPGISLATVQRQCIKAGGFVVGDQDTVKVIAARLDGRPYYACYLLSAGSVQYAVVIDGEGFKAPDRIAKRYGAWPWVVVPS